MKTSLLSVAAWLMLSFSAFAAEEPLMLNVWPGTPPGDAPDRPGEEVLNPRGMLLTGNVNTPTLAVYRPAKDKDTGAAVLICPGGGFFQLSMRDEGSDVALWLNSLGVTGVVLKYRIPNRPDMPRYMAGFQDAQRSMSLIRSKAAEWGLDPNRIGILGFSAGGQMAADVETNFDQRVYPAMDDVDKVDSKPNFAILIYPGGIVQKNSEVPALTEDVHVSKDTPPTFLAIAHDDRNGPENAIYLYLALKKAGVPAELHVFADGGHGYGIRVTKDMAATWPARAADWMAHRGYLKPMQNATPQTPAPAAATPAPTTPVSAATTSAPPTPPTGAASTTNKN